MTELMQIPQNHTRYIAVDNEGYITEAHKTPQEAIESLREVFQCGVNHLLRTSIVEYRLIEVNTAFRTYDDTMYGDHISEHPELQNQPTTIAHLLIEPEAPSCKQGKHVWSLLSIHSENANIIDIDKCDKCNLQRVKQTWNQCTLCGQDGFITTKYLESEE